MAVFMQPIYTQTVGAGGTGALTFNNIPQGFTDLKIVVSARTLLSGFDNLMLRFNNDTNVDNYSTTSVYADGASVVSERVLDFYTLSYAAGSLPNALSAANTFGSLDVYIPNYNAATFKQAIIDNVAENNVASLYIRDTMGSSLYRSTAPITSVSVFAFGNLAQHTTVTLYGVSNVFDTVVPIAPTLNSVTDQAGFAAVAFTPAANDRSESYVVTSNPSGSVTYGQASPIKTPAALGTAYTYSVGAVNSLSTSTSAASASLTSDNSFASIATVSFADSSSASATFNDIPQHYRHLQLRCFVRMAQSQSTPYDLTVTVNSSNTSGDYSFHTMRGDGATSSLTGQASDVALRYTTAVPNGSMTSGVFGFVVVDIMNYTDNTKNKTTRALFGYDNGTGSAPTAGWVGLSGSTWYQFSPISSLIVASFGNFAQFSHVALYGIA